MGKYVITPEVATHLAKKQAEIGHEHQLLAPTLIRSQLLAHLYAGVQSGAMAKTEADQCLDYVRGLRIRLLGDRVLQRVAWRIADQLGWEGTFDAEYVALTQLQADALITLDEGLSHSVRDLVVVVAVETLYQ